MIKYCLLETNDKFLGGRMKKNKNYLQVRKLKLKPLDYCVLILACIAILFLMLEFSLYTHKMQNNQIDLIHLMMEKMSVNQKTQFEHYIDEKVQTLQALVTYPDIYEMDEEKQSKFIKNRSCALGFSHLFIVNTDGIGFYIEEDIRRNQKQEQFFKDIMEHEIFITEPFYADSETVIMTACVSVYNKEQEKVGVLCGAIHLDSIQELIEKNEMILHGDCFILNESGIYMTSKNKSDVYQRVSIYNQKNSEVSLIEQAFLEQKDKEGVIVLDGIEQQAQITYLKDYNWVIVQVIPSHEITGLFAIINMRQAVLGICIGLLILCIIRIIYCWNKSNNKIYIDTLTKCNSRAACLDLLESLEKKKNRAITIIFMDLNNFKFVNDTFGHDKGDELLCIFSRALEQTFGKIGFVGRMGGDEFISILFDVTDEQIQEVWNALCEILKERSKTLDFAYEISSSYGYGTREKGKNIKLQEIIRCADEKMYEYKAWVKQNKN